MTSRAMASRPVSQAGNGAPSLQRAHSRFLEGSMNDRTSAAPPPNFLGPEEATIYEQQFYDSKRGSTASQASSQQQQQQQQQRRPGTAIGEVSKRGSTGFFAPLWDGVREKLSLTRSRSSNSITTTATGKIGESGKEYKISEPIQIQQPNATSTAAAAATGQPSREEILQNYQNLMASGFFSSHAIQSTRQPPPGQGQGHHRPHTANRNSAPANHSFAQRLAAQEMPAPARAPPPVPTSPPKAQTKYSPFPPPTRPPPVPLAIPYAATKPVSFEASSLPTPSSARPSTDYDTMPSPNRGTKRTHAAVEVAPAETSETGARKFAKKLRKSASRVSVDLSIAKTRSRPSTATTASAATSNSGLPKPAITPRSSMSLMRSWSASWRNSHDSGSSKADGALSAALAKIPTTGTAGEPERTERNRLKKREIRGRRLRRNSSKSPRTTRQRSGSRGRRSSSPCALPIMRPGTNDGPRHHQQEAPFTHTNPLRAHPTHAQTENGGGDAMEGVEFVVPSFHYPQRMRPGLPLSVVPDANRGIPQIPQIPAQYKAGRELASTNDENRTGAWAPHGALYG